jgi:hypothetical protein
MAEHWRHREARVSGFVRPRSIQTLAQFAGSWTSQKAAPLSFVASLLARAGHRLSEFRGFQTAAANLLEEAPLHGLRGEWAPIQAEVERELSARGMARRSARLADAARAVSSASEFPYGRVEFQGFYSLAPPEADLISALGQRTHVSVSLPEWPSAEAALRRLKSSGFAEQQIPKAERAAKLSLFTTPTIEREAEEIARRILDQTAGGRKFRDIGILLRTRDPYGPLIETTLARFGIPARFYFTGPLASHPAIAFLTGIVHAILADWDLETLLKAVRMPVSGIGATPAGDRLDFEWREKLPARGRPPDHDLLARLRAFDPLRRERRTAAEWAARLQSLRALVPFSPGPSPVRDLASVQRSTAAALHGFADALAAAAEMSASSAEVTLGDFWPHVELVLAHEPLRVPDRRRNAVHVMDVFEGRQWELPVVFLCGLTERHFPQYHREDPLIGDAERRRLGLDTAADRQRLERYLFDSAITLATEETILSYPRFNEKGEETLPSLFIDPALRASDISTALRAGSSSPPQPRQPLNLNDPELSNLHQRLSPTSIEDFLQCPFKFFAKKTLRLRMRPPAPGDRLDVLRQGSILHRALAEWAATPVLGTAVLDRVFDEECARGNVPATYRTEAVRLELLRNFEAFVSRGYLPLAGWTSRTEQSFVCELTPALAIRGRIDRLEQGPDRQAIVIDYKYSAAPQIRSRVKDSAGGDQVQAGLYLMAAERCFGLSPSGMLFCGLKKDITWDGWHVSIQGLEQIGTASTREFLDELLRSAVKSAQAAHTAILAGEIAVRPADPGKCVWCGYRDICRVDTI